MNLELPKKQRMPRKRIALYITVAVICVLAITIVIGVQILGNDIIDNFFGVTKLTKRSEQEENELKTNFENLFQNQFENKENTSTTNKIEQDRDIVHTYYQKDESTENYEININLPYINIENDQVKNFNEEISNTFESKSEEIINENSQNSIYTVKYFASIKNNILSVALYSDLKQGTNAQRVIIETLNYNLNENKIMSLEDILNTYDLNENEVQNKINEDIKEEQRKADELRELGYDIFSRDINSNIYEIKNITEYFIYNENIYIVFAYGNNQLTTEMDIVII